MFAFWSTIPQKINPIAFQLGNFKVLWYSLSYLAAFLTVYLLLKLQIRKKPGLAKKIFKNSRPFESVETLFLYCIVGLFLGAKLGFILFYDLANFLTNPLRPFNPFFQGEFIGISGLSFHGGVIGIVLAGSWFCKKYSLKFLAVANFIILAIPLGYCWGRIGNFLNGELYGRLTSSSLGMCFPKAGGCLAGKRHPSQLYEALGEGLLLFLILWLFYQTKLGRKLLFPLWLIGYGLIRFVIEFFREPDIQLGLVTFHLTVGQLLCFGMIITGLTMILYQKSSIATPYKSTNKLYQ